jgi:hypothetical protein
MRADEALKRSSSETSACGPLMMAGDYGVRGGAGCCGAASAMITGKSTISAATSSVQ